VRYAQSKATDVEEDIVELILKLLALWGIGDSGWMALDPPAWSRFWGRLLAYIGEGGVGARVFALVQLAFCLYLLLRPARRPA
jgi:hypothetical protein